MRLCLSSFSSFSSFSSHLFLSSLIHSSLLVSFRFGFFFLLLLFSLTLSEMKRKISEIPGYYFDEATNRYYKGKKPKSKSADASSSSFSCSSSSVATSSSSSSSPISASVYARSIGCPVDLMSQLWSSVCKPKWVMSFPFPPSSHHYHSLPASQLIPGGADKGLSHCCLC